MDGTSTNDQAAYTYEQFLADLNQYQEKKWTGGAALINALVIEPGERIPTDEEFYQRIEAHNTPVRQYRQEVFARAQADLKTLNIEVTLDRVTFIMEWVRPERIPTTRDFQQLLSLLGGQDQDRWFALMNAKGLI